MDVRELLDRLIKMATERSSKSPKIVQRGKTVTITIECSEELFKEVFSQPYWSKVNATKHI
jgi:hypothetical protein